MPPRLYSGPLSMFGAKVEIALHEKGVAFDLVMVPFDMERLYDPKHPEVARINPKRQVPVLVDGGLELFDSTQIFEYLEDRWPVPPLWPVDPAARARARQIEHLSDEVYFPPVVRLMGLQSQPGDPAAMAARDSCTAFYRRMEATLGDAEWLAGRYGYADIAFFMAQLFGARMGAPMTDATPALLRWRTRMAARPAVRRVAGAMARYLLSVDRPLPPFLEAMVEADGA